ncbi:hypothetical protein L2E82_38861 [Cichorium intybus]|uniref:Uncharacterized protein n=1 Tax=Cichorium intybus TaxID=13427 RepID=A0ACB9AHD4_CICIN|nr:hypothetical protein L2E82_38861 [Cichorium intybus]
MSGPGLLKAIGIRIEAKQQRVVVTGDVSPVVLLRKLLKAGKHAELWPEKPPEIPPQKNEKPPTSNQGSVSEEYAVSTKEIKPPASRTEKPIEDLKRVGKTAAPAGGEPESSGGKGDEGVGKTEGGKVAVEVL